MHLSKNSCKCTMSRDHEINFTCTYTLQRASFIYMTNTRFPNIKIDLLNCAEHC